MGIHAIDLRLGFLFDLKAGRAEGQADGIARVFDADGDQDDGDGHLIIVTAEADAEEDMESGNKVIGDKASS